MVSKQEVLRFSEVFIGRLSYGVIVDGVKQRILMTLMYRMVMLGKWRRRVEGRRSTWCGVRVVGVGWVSLPEPYRWVLKGVYRRRRPRLKLQRRRLEREEEEKGEREPNYLQG